MPLTITLMILKPVSQTYIAYFLAIVFICTDFRGGSCWKAGTNDGQRGTSSVGTESNPGVCCVLVVFLCRSLSAGILQVHLKCREPSYLELPVTLNSNHFPLDILL